MPVKKASASKTVTDTSVTHVHSTTTTTEAAVSSATSVRKPSEPLYTAKKLSELKSLFSGMLEDVSLAHARLVISAETICAVYDNIEYKIPSSSQIIFYAKGTKREILRVEAA